MTVRSLPGLVAALLLAVPAPAPDAAPRWPARMTPGAELFWELRDASGEPCGSNGCRAWELRVTGEAARLRIAADGGQAVQLDVVSPDGTRISRPGSWSVEVFVPDPAPGIWRVEASGDARTRLRAKLERTVPAPPRNRALLPNIRLIPPYEVTFSALGPGGCLPDEIAEHGARTCLRFSLGPENVGEGPLRLRFEPLTGVTDRGRVYQIVQYADGRAVERVAGTFEYHKTHAHYHHSGFGSLELLRVEDPRTGRMRRVGAGPKQGFCMLDLKIADWRRFFQAEAGSTPQDCGVVAPPAGAHLGLTHGWGDIYTYSQSGNYVEFAGAGGDGRFVIRSVADALGHVAETDENDNAGYAYIEVSGRDVRILQRGRGLSPWDPRRVVVDDRLH